jgi:adenine-specific DNA methylase
MNNGKRRNLLAYFVKKFSQKVWNQALGEIQECYQNGHENSELSPIAYLWVKIFSCPNPLCGTEIPLLRHFYLANKKKRKIAIKPIIKNKCIEFIVQKEETIDFDPSKGTITLGKIRCLACNVITKADELRAKTLKEGLQEQLYAIVYTSRAKKSRIYYVPSITDQKNFQRAKELLKAKLENWSFPDTPIPDELIRTPSGKPLTSIEDPFFVHLQFVNYGIKTWGDLYNTRQKLSLLTFLHAIRNSFESIYTECKKSHVSDPEEMAIIFDRFMSYNTVLNRWVSGGESIANCFSRTGLAMVYDYPETNPFSDSFSWNSQVKWVLRVIEANSLHLDCKITITSSSATKLPYSDGYFDAIITDPPYYDNVPYADLSDFFYVLLKRSIGDLFPELFTTPLTPKLGECIANDTLLRRFSSIDRQSYDYLGIKNKSSFVRNLSLAFRECFRILKPEGIALIVYAHKTTDGWETVIKALIDSGFVVTASWPFHTEMKNRLRARESATLISSIYMICRKLERKEIGFYIEVKKELLLHLSRKMEFLWNVGISGSDFFISVIGAGIEVFSRYEKVLDIEGNNIEANKFLEDIRSEVINYSIKKILQNDFSEYLTPLTRFYVIWRWNYKELKLEFDEARKLAQSVGISLDKEWNKGFIKKEKNLIKLLNPKERLLKDLENSNELIDILHYVLLMWEKSEKELLLTKLSQTIGDNDTFYRVAQAISESLPNESKEKKLLDGFLVGKEKLKQEIIAEKKKPKQRKLEL